MSTDNFNAILDDIMKVYDLKEQEALIYLYLLRYGDATAREIAKDLNIKRQRVYALLDNLTAAGFTTLLPFANVRRYRAINPVDVFEKTLHKYFLKLEEKQAQFATLLEKLHKTDVTTQTYANEILLLESVETIIDYLSLHIEKIKSFIYISAANIGLKIMPHLYKTIADKVKRSPMIKIKILFPDVQKMEERVQEYYHSFRLVWGEKIKEIVEIKTTNELFQTMITIDDEISFLFFLATPMKLDFALYIKSKPFALELKRLFERRWENGQSLIHSK